MEILYEDNHIIAAVKPSGVLSQSDGSGAPDMLTLLKAYIKEKYNKPGNVYLGLVHRLDRNVSGVMVFARTSKAASRLSAQIREHTTEKLYYAVVEGKVSGEGTLRNWILKDEKTNTVKVLDREEKGAKFAELSYRAVDSTDGTTLLEVDLKTGRSHQIRAQLAASGHPITGDVKYGRAGGKDRIALMCHSMTIDHPTSKERMTFKCDMPDSHQWILYKNRF